MTYIIHFRASVRIGHCLHVVSSMTTVQQHSHRQLHFFHGTQVVRSTQYPKIVALKIVSVRHAMPMAFKHSDHLKATHSSVHVTIQAPYNAVFHLLTNPGVVHIQFMKRKNCLLVKGAADPTSDVDNAYGSIWHSMLPQNCSCFAAAGFCRKLYMSLSPRDVKRCWHAEPGCADAMGIWRA